MSLNIINILAAAIPAGAALAGLLTSLFASRTSKPEITRFEIKFQATDDPAKDSRLADAQRALDQQESLAKSNSRAAASLTFRQYIIGGALASSFVQESLTSQVVGFLAFWSWFPL